MGIFIWQGEDDRLMVAPAFTWTPDGDMSLTILGELQRSKSGGTFAYVNENNRVTDVAAGDPSFNDLDQTQGRIGFELEQRLGEGVTFRQQARCQALGVHGEYASAIGAPVGDIVRRGKPRSRGVEMEGTVTLLDGLSVTLAYAYTDLEIVEGTETTTGQTLSFTPGHTVSLWGDDTVRTGALEGLGFGAGLRCLSRSFGDDKQLHRRRARLRRRHGPLRRALGRGPEAAGERHQPLRRGHADPLLGLLLQGARAQPHRLGALPVLTAQPPGASPAGRSCEGAGPPARHLRRLRGKARLAGGKTGGGGGAAGSGCPFEKEAAP